MRLKFLKIQPAGKIGFFLDIAADVDGCAFMNPQVQVFPFTAGFSRWLSQVSNFFPLSETVTHEFGYTRKFDMAIHYSDRLIFDGASLNQNSAVS